GAAGRHAIAGACVRVLGERCGVSTRARWSASCDRRAVSPNEKAPPACHFGQGRQVVRSQRRHIQQDASGLLLSVAEATLNSGEEAPAARRVALSSAKIAPAT